MLPLIKAQLAKFETNTRLFEFLNHSVVVLMGIFIFFNPFPHTTSIKEGCFYLSFFIVLFLVLFKKTEFSFKTPLLLPFGLFVFWAFLSIFFALDKQNSIHDFRSHLLEYIVLYYILVNYFGSRRRLVGLSWIIIISTTIFSIGGMFYFYFILGKKLSWRFGYLSFTEIPTNVIGIIIVFAIILSLHHLLRESHLYRKVILSVCLFLLYSAALLTQARATVVALFLSVIILFIKKKTVLVTLLLAMLILVAITPVKSRLFRGNLVGIFRIGINYLAFEVVKDHPITGVGFGMETYRTAIDLHAYNARVPDKYKEEIHVDPHNMVGSIAVRTGFVGLALFFYIVFAFLKICWRIIKHGKDDFIKSWGLCTASAFSVFFVIGLFEPVFSHTPEVVLCTIFSMTTILWRLNNDTESA